MSTPDQDRRDELASLHALGVLTDAERVELATVAADDPAFAADLRALEGTVAALGGSVAQVEPPPGLRARVLASVAGADAATVTPIRRVPSARAPVSLSWLAAAASLIAAAGLGLWAWRIQDRLQEVESRLTAAQDEVTTVRRTLGSAQDQVRILKAQADVFLAPDMKLVLLAGQPAAPAASARAYWSRRGGMVFAASALPPLPADKAYQVWVIAEAVPPISAGLLEIREDGSALRHFDTPADIPTPKVLAVTLEPAGGVPQPTGDKVLVGTTGL